ncbi:MAG: hypothetical protein LBE34_04715 [Flavobacteriaceae bacterium]|jgi:hypothetical protein|nr:hypothetical protein [Flavobacteriaceae bacterium]
MKLTKLFAAIAILGLLTASCSSDDNSPIPVNPVSEQKEIGKEMPFVGDYQYSHSGMPIPISLEKKVITMKMSQMAGSGQEDDIYSVLTVYQNKEGVYKAVAKNKDAKEYKAFFFRNKQDKSIEINLDYTFTTEIEAINTTYPKDSNTAPDHGAMKFGWLKFTILDDTKVEIKLLVNGKYSFSSQGHTYYYNFTNEVVNFNGAYDMKVLSHNTKTNKILLKGISGDEANNYYVIQLKNITDTKVDIARMTYKTTDAKALAEKDFASQVEVEAKFTTYEKETNNNNQAFSTLKGTYETIKMNGGIAQYRFKIGNNDEAFLFMAADGDKMTESATLKLERVFANEATGQLIYKIASSTGYYGGRDGQFITLYVKDIAADGSKATFAIATKDGSGSIAASKGDVIGKTLDEAKKIVAPAADKLWGENMMIYAHVWIKTTRQ